MMNESMRMATPLLTLTPRISTKDHMLKDIPVTKGTMLTSNFIANNHKYELFSDPFAFRPERW